MRGDDLAGRRVGLTPDVHALAGGTGWRLRQRIQRHDVDLIKLRLHHNHIGRGLSLRTADDGHERQREIAPMCGVDHGGEVPVAGFRDLRDAWAYMR